MPYDCHNLTMESTMIRAMLLGILITAGLAACTTTAELARLDHEDCTNYGYDRETNPGGYADCRMHVAQSREARDNMTRAALFIGRPYQ